MVGPPVANHLSSNDSRKPGRTGPDGLSQSRKLVSFYAAWSIKQIPQCVPLLNKSRIAFRAEIPPTSSAVPAPAAPPDSKAQKPKPAPAPPPPALFARFQILRVR